MSRVTLRKAVEILAEQGVEVAWNEDLNMLDFFDYYDKHYEPKLMVCRSTAQIREIGLFFDQDILNVFNKDLL